MKVLAILITVLLAGTAGAQTVDDSVRPTSRADANADWFVVPPSVQAQAATNQPDVAQALVAGAVCGDIALQGDSLGDHSGPGACGVQDAVRLQSVAGVALSTPAIMDCTTAQALRTWVDTGLTPAVGDTGGGVASIRIVAHYACRTRNNQSGARLSEHALGHAVDIAGIGLQDGREITVLTDWNNGDFGQRLRDMWRAACGPFGTVLGPEADRFHRDHFHFDTARYRSGSYCR